MNGRDIRILAIGMVDSPHFVRWLEQFQDENLHIQVFPSSPNRQVHPRLLKLCNDPVGRAQYEVPAALVRLSLFVFFIDLLLRGRARRFLLTRRIKDFHPEVIHALEIQHAGYLLLGVLKGVDQSVRIVVTNYGSDLYWFARFPAHAKKIRELLKSTDFYGAECQRDLDLARKYGFNGQFLNVVPNAGGIQIEQTRRHFEEQRTSARSIILIKGYTNFVGRAQDILLRLNSVHDDLSNARLVVYSSTIHARFIVWWLRRVRGFTNIESLPKRSLSHEQMLRLFSQARLYVGFSKSDGISTSMLEAMSLGCIPLQTDTACIDEWKLKGAKIVDLDFNNPDDAIDQLVKVWNLGSDLDTYAKINRRIAEQHLDSKIIQDRVRGTYHVVSRRD